MMSISDKSMTLPSGQRKIQGACGAKGDEMLNLSAVESVFAQPSAGRVQRMALLQLIGHELDLTDTQRGMAHSRYEAVGNWIAQGDAPELESAVIYPQGSLALGTATKPIDVNEFDVDLICRLSEVTPSTPPASVKRLIGERVMQNAHYAEMLEEKQRCWRLNYAGEFHLDITPSIPNPDCRNGGELVPDKQLRKWKPTNPRGYRTRFEQYAAIEPLFDAQFAEAPKRVLVEPLPDSSAPKGTLRLIVQICKRHRDIYFSTRDRDLAPVSVILTTLAAQSYAHHAQVITHASELDLLADVVRTMQLFIERQKSPAGSYYLVRNETTTGENFADKWNADPRLAAAFFEWHDAVKETITNVQGLRGIDQLSKSLSMSFGERPVNAAIAQFTRTITTARETGLLSVAAGEGISVGRDRGVAIRPNTFFGR